MKIIQYQLILTDPYERFEILSGNRLERLTRGYYLFTSGDGRSWLLSARHVGFHIEDVFRGEHISVNVDQVVEPSSALFRAVQSGGEQAVMALIREGKIKPYAIGDIRTVEGEQETR